MFNSIKTTNHNIGKFALLFAALFLFLSSCKKEEEPVDACSAANSSHEWGYDNFGGPDCWNSVCSSPTCTGNAQSPVNVTGAVTTTTLPALYLAGSNIKTDILNNGHTIEFKMQPGVFSTFGLTANNLIDDFTLGQFHFHANSEHQINGSYAPLEAHFVHRSIWDDRYLVISVMIKEGAENVLLKNFTGNLPTNAEDVYVQDAITYNPYDLLPASKSFYHYSGSLTTPPCSEVVTWIIMEDAVEASKAQIDEFTAILDSNFRPLQELNGRTISYRQ